MNKFLTFNCKKTFSFILFVFMIVYAFCYEGDIHKAQMCDMLFSFEFVQNKDLNKDKTNLYREKFKEFRDKISDKELKKIEMLDSASYLAIDFFNSANRGEKDLRALKNAHIRNLPVSISEIDYKAGSDHQKYTHRGWNFRYLDDKAHWKIRKDILLNAAAKIFDKNPHAKEIDAFCALVYYCHILGDHEGDSRVTSGTRMEFGGRADKETILDDLVLNVIPVLFGKNGTKLVSQLKVINSDVDKLMRRNNDGTDPRREPRKLTDEEYSKYQKYTTQTLRLLQKQIPILLQQQPWFTEAFPSAKKL